MDRKQRTETVVLTDKVFYEEMGFADVELYDGDEYNL
jgi:hypothetical protein